MMKPMRDLAQAVVDAWTEWFELDTDHPEYEQAESLAYAKVGKAVMASDMVQEEAIRILTADAQGYERALMDVLEYTSMRQARRQEQVDQAETLTNKQLFLASKLEAAVISGWVRRKMRSLEEGK